jgi:hypothetical protein
MPPTSYVLEAGEGKLNVCGKCLIGRGLPFRHPLKNCAGKRPLKAIFRALLKNCAGIKK